MTRTEIIDEAKRLVLNNGPSNVLEFGFEILTNHMSTDDPRWEHREAILREAFKQADRVYHFLGYNPPR